MEKGASLICPNCRNSKSVFLEFEKNGFKLFFCKTCQNGFTYPSPKSFAKYYTRDYWIGRKLFLKVIKNFINAIFQLRRKMWVTKFALRGKVLDVGSGEGRFAKSLPKTFETTNLDPYFFSSDKNFVKKDLLKWKTYEKFDLIVFWESLEHVTKPTDYLSKANKLLTKNGKIFIECPKYDSIESKIFNKNWFHLDIPRHMSHFTEKGIYKLLVRTNFRDIKIKKISAPEYTLWGFIASLFSILSIEALESVKKGNIVVFLVAIPIIPVAVLAQIFFYVLDSTPLMLVSARKMNN